MATEMVGSLTLIREFDSKSTGISVTEFLNQVCEVGELNGWNAAKKILVARLKMTGPARLFRDHDEGFRDITDWDTFCDEMRKRFSPILSDDAQLFKYLNASQKENETILDFATRLSVLHDKAKPAPAGETAADKTARLAAKYVDLKPLLLHGMLDKHLARRVLDRSPKTFKEALSMATHLEANNKTFDPDGMSRLCINAVGSSSGVKKGPKIYFKQLQDKSNENNSRPTTPTNAFSHSANFGPSGSEQRNPSQGGHSYPRQQASRGNYFDETQQPRGGFRGRSFSQRRGDGPGRHNYAHPSSAPRDTYSPHRNSPQNQQYGRDGTPFSSCYICGATNHWANRCPQRRQKRSYNNQPLN